MATYFLDTSAIVKRDILEQGQAWILSLCDPAQGHDLYISQAALVEVVATICRRAREQSINMTERDRLINVFRQDSKESYNIWPVTTDLYTSGGDLCRSHRLRAYDAVQLACVLALRQDMLANQAPEPIFACADVVLLDIAGTAGLRVENPNNYPKI
jgi:predicted nucleic acid-binding protein